MNIIGKVRKSAFERSVEGIIKSVEINYSMDSFLAPREYFYEKGTLTLLTVEGKVRDENIGIHGKIEGKGFIYVDEEGTIHIENLCDKSYCANGEEENIEITPNPDGQIPEINKDYPVIKLNGEKTVYVEIGGVYKEEGAIAKTIGGKELEYTKEIKYNNETVEEIETTSEREYTIIYSTENEGKRVSVTRTVVVLEMTPVITMTEPNEDYVKEQEILITVSGIRPNKVERFRVDIKKNGAEINSEEVEGVTKRITLNESGSYEVIVSVTDNNGHTNEVSKTYRISNSKPVITVNPERVTLEVSEVAGYNILSGVSATDEIDGVIESSKIITTSDLSATPGTYTITYKVTNSIGNTSTATRTITVESSECTISTKIVGGKTVTDCFREDTSGATRYSGGNPKNYVCFGDSNITNPGSCDANHKWRIIGVDGDGRIKLMTNYYGLSGNLRSVEQQLSSFYNDNTYIDTTHRGYTSGAAWNKGTNKSEIATLQSFIDSISMSALVETPGLMDVIDFGYAGSNCTLSTEMNQLGNACMSNNWIGHSNNQWTMNSAMSVGNTNQQWAVHSDGMVIPAPQDYSGMGARPVVYLDASVKIKAGTGTAEDPYILEKPQPMSGNDLAAKDKLPELAGLKRYRGANPNNWVCFGDSSITNTGGCDANHKWRIIGVDGDGRIKLMTNYYGLSGNLRSVEQQLSSFYNDNTYIDTTHRGYTSGAAWNEGTNKSEKATLQSFIDSISMSSPKGTPGLMDVIDFGYAGSNCTLSTEMNQLGNACMSNNWIGHSHNQWTMNSAMSVGNTNQQWAVHSDGMVIPAPQDYNGISARPVLYLDASVKIIGGIGTENQPYILKK